MFVPHLVKTLLNRTTFAAINEGGQIYEAMKQIPVSIAEVAISKASVCEYLMWIKPLYVFICLMKNVTLTILHCYIYLALYQLHNNYLLCI